VTLRIKVFPKIEHGPEHSLPDARHKKTGTKWPYEEIANMPRKSEKVDIYGISAILYFLLSTYMPLYM